MEQRDKIKKLSVTLNKLFCCHFHVFQKYNKNFPEFVESHLNLGYDDKILQNCINWDWTVYRTYPLKTFSIIHYFSFRVARNWYHKNNFMPQSDHKSWHLKNLLFEVIYSSTDLSIYSSECKGM